KRPHPACRHARSGLGEKKQQRAESHGPQFTSCGRRRAKPTTSLEFAQSHVGSVSVTSSRRPLVRRTGRGASASTSREADARNARARGVITAQLYFMPDVEVLCGALQGQATPPGCI